MTAGRARRASRRTARLRLLWPLGVAAGLLGAAGCSYDTGVHVSDGNPRGEVRFVPALIDPNELNDTIGGYSALEAQRETGDHLESSGGLDNELGDNAVGLQTKIPF